MPLADMLLAAQATVYMDTEVLEWLGMPRWVAEIKILQKMAWICRPLYRGLSAREGKRVLVGGTEQM